MIFLRGDFYYHGVVDAYGRVSKYLVAYLRVDPPVREFVLGEDDQAGAVGGEADR